LLGAIAPSEQRAWVESANRRLFGDLGERSIAAGHSHAMWSVLFAPLGSVGSYDAGGPLRLLDNRHGLAVFRNRYRDADDTVFAVYAKAFHGGGHTHDDAGSFRLRSLGAGWAHAGGQAKPQPWHQNVPLRNGGRPDGAAQETGKVSYYAAHESGGSVSIDLGRVYRVPRVRRHFAVEFEPFRGVEALVAVWDEIVDDDEAASWSFPLCYERGLDPELLRDGRYTLRSADDATLSVSVGGADRVELADRAGEPSHRVFSEGSRSEYPPARYVAAAVDGFDRGVLTVMTVGRGDAPPVEFAGFGYDLHAVIGGRLVARLDRSRWFNGPLRIHSLTTGNPR